MPKICFCIIVHNGMPFLPLNLENIYPYAHKIVIIEGPVKFYHNMGPSSDGTIEAIKSFPDPEGKIVLEQGMWDEKDSMVRAQEKYFDGDFLWVPDSDEFWKKEDMEKVIKYLDSHTECYSMSFNLISFFCSLEKFIGGFESEFETHRIQKLSPGARWLGHRPPTLIWTPTGRTCKEMGHVDATAELGVRIFHYSHLPPKRLAHKSKYYNQLSSSILPNYFEKIVIPWMKAKTDEERMVVERQFEGVQEFKSSCRTPAYTIRFDGRHPDVIERARPAIEEQIMREARELGIL